MSDTSGPAFPTVNYKQPGGIGVSVMEINGGITARDYFAAKAMQAFVGREAFEPAGDYDRTISRYAYEMADAMLEARQN